MMIGYDNDCNAGTVGAVLGAVNGTRAIAESWKTPLRDPYQTTLNLPEKRLKISTGDYPMMKRLMSFVLCLGAVVAAGLAGPGEPLWLDRTTGFPEIADLPMLRRGVQTHQFCSYDRAGDNYDHDYFPLYLEPDGQCVIFDAYGPGCLHRQQMNLWRFGVFPGDNASRKLVGVRIRYYFDDSRTP